MRLLAAFSLVLVPGLFAWWTGRALVRRRDDPLLAEQLMALDLARGHGVRATLPEDAGTKSSLPGYSRRLLQARAIRRRHRHVGRDRPRLLESPLRQ